MEVEDTPGTEKAPTPPAEESAPAPAPSESSPVPMESEASTAAAPPSEVAVPDDVDSPSADAPLGADRKLRERTPKAYKGADEPAPDEEELEAKKAKAAKRKAEDDALAAKARRKRAAGQKLRPIEPLAAPENLKTWRSWLESLPDDTTLERALGQPVPSAVPPSLRLHTPDALIGHLLHVHQFLHAFGPQLGQSTDPHDPLGLAGLGLREIDAAVVHGDLPATHTLHITLLRQLAKCAIRHHEQLASDTEKDAYHDFLASAETDDGVDDFLHLDAPTARAVLDTLAATHQHITSLVLRPGAGYEQPGAAGYVFPEFDISFVIEFRGFNA